MNRNSVQIRRVRPLVLDFDASVPPLAAGETRLPLAAWQESIRFGCSWRDFSRLEEHLIRVLPEEYGCVFSGSGDFHHLTLFLLQEAIRRAGPGAAVDLVVCDNHPDNMRYPFGLHCGSWVSHAAALGYIRRVHVLGICSPDITPLHAWENRLTPFLRRKLTYWSIGRRADWLGLIGRKNFCRAFSTADDLINAFLAFPHGARRVYLSIDKDVLGPDAVTTDWDQGVFTAAHLKAVIDACGGRIIGADICGDVSGYRYAGMFKRLLSRLDGQRRLSPADLAVAQKEQGAMNDLLLKWIRAC